MRFRVGRDERAPPVGAELRERTQEKREFRPPFASIMATPKPLPAGGGEIPNSLSPSFLASIAYSAAQFSSLRGLGAYTADAARLEDLVLKENEPRARRARGAQVFESQIGVARTESPSTP